MTNEINEEINEKIDKEIKDAEKVSKTESKSETKSELKFESKSETKSESKSVYDKETVKRIKVTAAIMLAAGIITGAAALLFCGGTYIEVLSFISVMCIIMTLIAAAKLAQLKTKKRFLLIFSVIGLVMACAGLYMQTCGAAAAADWGTWTTLGIIMFIICFAGYRKSEESRLQDERSLKIGTYGIAYSWYLTMLVVILLFWLNYTGIAVIKTEIALGLVMILMPVSAVIFQRYFYSRGDVY